MSKRGQVTVFIIVGIIIVIFAGIFFSASYHNKKTLGEKQKVSEIETSSIEYYIGSCLERTLKEGLIFLGEHGGFFELPENSDKLLLLPYFYMEGEPLLPPLKVFRQELEKYIDKMLPFCFQNFAPFVRQGFSIKAGSIQTETFLSEKNAAVKIVYPLEVKRDVYVKELSAFERSILFSYPKLHGFLTVLLEEQMKNPEYVPVFYLTAQEEYLFNISSASDGTVQFELIDEKTVIEGKPYSFFFLFKYNWDLSTGPEVEPIPSFNLSIGESLEYQVEAKGGFLNYLVSHLADISEEGVITYTAVPEDVGEHTIAITITDSSKLETIQLMEIEVHE